MIWNVETRILRADECKWVTEDDENFVIEVKLAPSESPDNWWEVDELSPVPGPDEENIYKLANEYINTEPEE